MHMIVHVHTYDLYNTYVHVLHTYVHYTCIIMRISGKNATHSAANSLSMYMLHLIMVPDEHVYT